MKTILTVMIVVLFVSCQYERKRHITSKSHERKTLVFSQYTRCLDVYTVGYDTRSGTFEFPRLLEVSSNVYQDIEVGKDYYFQYMYYPPMTFPDQ